GDAAGDVQLRRNILPRLPDLRRVGIPARVDDRARRRHRAAERLRQVLDEGEVLGAAETAPAGDDDLRVLDRGARLLLVRLLDHRRLGREVLELDRRLHDLRLAAGGGRLERARPHDADAGLSLPTHVDVDGVAERRPLADQLAVLADEIDEI